MNTLLLILIIVLVCWNLYEEKRISNIKTFYATAIDSIFESLVESGKLNDDDYDNFLKTFERNQDPDAYRQKQRQLLRELTIKHLSKKDNG